MSDSCLYEFEDIVWDEVCRSDDHIVPRPGFQRADDHSILGDSHKRPRFEVTSFSINTGDRSAAGYPDQGREHEGFSSLSRRRKTMLEKDSESHVPSGIFPSSSDSDSMKEASSLASENTMSSSQRCKSNNKESNGSEVCANDTIPGDKTTAVDSSALSYPLGEISRTGNNLSIFENTEDKDSSDFLYYGWPEIGNFEDVDSMFRSCDSTFGLGASKEDELCWLSSEDNIGGSEDVVKSDFTFPSPESNVIDNILEHHHSSKSYSNKDSRMKSAPIGYKDSSWTSERSDSYLTFVDGPAMADSKHGLMPKEQFNEHKKQFGLQNHSVGKRKEHYYGNGSFSYMSNLPNEVMQLHCGANSHQAFPSVHKQQQALGPDSYSFSQNPLSYAHSNSSYLSDPNSVNPTPSAIKSETNDVTSLSPRESSHASSQFQSMESSHDPSFQMTAKAGNEKREKLHNYQASRSSVNSSSLKNASATVQASISNPGLIGEEVHFSGDKFENFRNTEGASLVLPAELGSSGVQKTLTMSSGLDDISLEAASFRQLQLVMEQLDLRTKLCIRDSLYRLARSAEQRHNHANLHGNCGYGRDPIMAEGTNNFMDIETDTNPIDRSIAHLLFHRPSESSAIPLHDSLPSKTPSTVQGSVTSPPLMEENLVICEETASEIEVSDRRTANV